jgi:hypothetical protein
VGKNREKERNERERERKGEKESLEEETGDRVTNV